MELQISIHSIRPEDARVYRKRALHRRTCSSREGRIAHEIHRNNDVDHLRQRIRGWDPYTLHPDLERCDGVRHSVQGVRARRYSARRLAGRRTIDIDGSTNASSEDSRTSDQSAGLCGTQVSETTCGVTRFAKSRYDILTSSECEPALNAISSSSVSCSATYTPMS